MEELDKINHKIKDIVREIDYYTSQKKIKTLPYQLHLELIELSQKKLDLEKESKRNGKFNNTK